MKVNINRNKFLERHLTRYKWLYENDDMGKDNYGIYRAYVDAFDDFTEAHLDFVRKYYEYTEDIILSGRDAAAFMIALLDIVGVSTMLNHKSVDFCLVAE